MNEQNTSNRASNAGNANSNLAEESTNVNAYGIDQQEWSRLDRQDQQIVQSTHEKLSTEVRQRYVQRLTAACSAGNGQSLNNIMNEIIGYVAVSTLRELHTTTQR